jgi:hypothetical protein
MATFFSHQNAYSQRKTDGNWPEPAFEKFPSGFDTVSMVELAEGDMGWFNNYLNAVMVDHAGRIWLAGEYGLAYSDDGGLKWKKSITKYSICEVYETPNHVLLASSNNSFVLRSDDRGKSWKHQKVFGSKGPTGQTSHGEHYDDIFYTNIDDKHILRTTQFSQKLLLSTNDGESWEIIEGPDQPDYSTWPERIFSIGDSIVVMFTHDQMYFSRDKCQTWTLEHEGLPVPKIEMYDVIENGTVMEDGTILAQITSQAEDVYERSLYRFLLSERRWIPDPSWVNFGWSEDDMKAIGDNRLLLYDYGENLYSISFDLGQTWTLLNGDYGYVNYAKDLHVVGDRIYFIESANLSVINLPSK